MKTGSPAPVSKKAIVAMDRISKILEKVPQNEWEFILKQAKDVVMTIVAMKALRDLYKKL